VDSLCFPPDPSKHKLREKRQHLIAKNTKNWAAYHAAAGPITQEGVTVGSQC